MDTYVSHSPLAATRYLFGVDPIGRAAVIGPLPTAVTLSAKNRRDEVPFEKVV